MKKCYEIEYKKSYMGEFLLKLKGFRSNVYINYDQFTELRSFDNVVTIKYEKGRYTVDRYFKIK
jgi:hypothetical protein